MHVNIVNIMFPLVFQLLNLYTFNCLIYLCHVLFTEINAAAAACQ